MRRRTNALRRPLASVAGSSVVSTTVASLSPNTGDRWSGAQNVGVVGTGFTVSSQAQVDGVNVTTVYNSPTSLTITIPRDKLWEIATLVVSVVGATGTANYAVVYPSFTVAHRRADSGLAFSSGNDVQTWTPGYAGTVDANKIASQLTVSKQPTYVASVAAANNRPALLGDGLSKRMVTGTYAAARTQPVARFTVCLFNATNTIFVDASATTNFMQFPASSVMTISAGVGLAGPSLSTGTVYLLGAEFNGASSKIYVNKKSANTTGNAGTIAAQGASLFSRFNDTQWMNGYIFEDIEINGTPSATFLTEYGDYVAARYGIAVAP